jgi:hypothetical protein
MEIIKKRICLENSIDRKYDSENWGGLTSENFYVNVFLTQTIDDMGMFIDTDFIEKSINNSQVDYSILFNKLQSLGLTFPFMLGVQPVQINNLNNNESVTLRLPNAQESDFYNFGNLPITGITDSKIEEVKSYNENNPFRIDFNVSEQTYVNYNNFTIIGVDRIKSMGEPKIYVFDTIEDVNLGTNNQISGIQYNDYTGFTSGFTVVAATTFRFIGEGWNMTNTSLSAITKLEYLFGIISPPEVESDVFIDRGATTVMDMHLRLSEIKNLGQLQNYGNGFYRILKQ